MLILAGVFTSCKDKNKPFLTVDKTSITATAEGGEYFIAVRSNVEWTAVAEPGWWCTLTNTSGTNNGVITVNVVENPSHYPRSKTIKITSENLTESVSVIVNQSLDTTEHRVVCATIANWWGPPCWIILIDSAVPIGNLVPFDDLFIFLMDHLPDEFKVRDMRVTVTFRLTTEDRKCGFSPYRVIELLTIEECKEF
ncbi:MAG: BACON domain-containing protein [Bacteroidales bacterium]|nr:BACON domain-containing protein [Bacteroidales bacterium]